MIYIKRNYHNLTYKHCNNSQRYRGNALVCKNCSSSPYLLPQKFGISVFPPMTTVNSIDISTSKINNNRLPETANNIHDVTESQVMPRQEPAILTVNDNQDEAESETTPQLDSVVEIEKEHIANADDINRSESIETAGTYEINNGNQNEAVTETTPPLDSVVEIKKENIANLDEIARSESIEIASTLEINNSNQIEPETETPLDSVVEIEKDNIINVDEINRSESIESSSTPEINNDNQDTVISKATQPLAYEVQYEKDKISITNDINKPDNTEIAYTPVKNDNKEVTSSKVMPMFKPAVLTEKEDTDIADERNRPGKFQTVSTTDYTIDNKDTAKSEPMFHSVSYTSNVNEKRQNKISRTDNEKKRAEDGLYGRGLFYYKNWWYRDKVDIIVNGEFISGIPIFKDHNTLRIVNDKHSYFVPVEKIDFIRTTDGFNV